MEAHIKGVCALVGGDIHVGARPDQLGADGGAVVFGGVGKGAVSVDGSHVHIGSRSQKEFKASKALLFQRPLVHGCLAGVHQRRRAVVVAFIDLGAGSEQQLYTCVETCLCRFH